MSDDDEQFFESNSARPLGYRPPRWETEKWGEEVHATFEAWAAVRERAIAEGRKPPSLRSLQVRIKEKHALPCSEYIVRRYAREVMGVDT